MKPATVLIEGNYVTPDFKVAHGQIRVVDGIIREVGAELGVADIAYQHDLTIYPGFVDIHVHAREYPLPQNPKPKDIENHERMTAKETFTTASNAAINGGVVAFGLMPNDQPNPPSGPCVYTAKQALAAKGCTIDHFVYALAEKGFEPFGDYPYKIYTHDLEKKEIRDVFSACASVAQRLDRTFYIPVVVAHCENAQVIAQEASRPVEAEARDVSLCIGYSAEYGIPVHFAHISCQKSLEFIVEAKGKGINVTCETTPTYLFFSNESRNMYQMRDWLFMKPPLRSESDRKAMLAAFVRGDIDLLATDHAPHTPADKEAGAFGIPLLDNYTNFIGWLKQEGIPLKRIVNACCVFPGRFMQHYTGERRGKIGKGYVGSFTVVGKKRPEEILLEPIMTKCGWSPFQGAVLGHKYLLYAHETIVRGVPLKSAMPNDSNSKRSEVRWNE